MYIYKLFIYFLQKQKFYIKEIERANEQLKETAAKLFVKKGFSKEQTDLFLKKVNFMENREYFLHKRNQMIGKKDDTESKVLNKEKINLNESQKYFDGKNEEQKL